ncbi:MAG: LamG-like jellyroll fold domain-containing protein, partial [Planctomycetota bacterium]
MTKMRNDESGWQSRRPADPPDGRADRQTSRPVDQRSQTLTHALISIVMLFLTAIMVYAIIFTWNLDPSTQGSYTVSDSTIRVISPPAIAELIRQPAVTYVHDTKSEYDTGDYGSPANLASYPDTFYIRLARHPNGGLYSDGNFTSRVSPVTNTSWSGLSWSDLRSEISGTGEANITALYHMNNAWSDSAGVANDGTPSGAVFATEGVFNQSGSFNGSTAYVTVPNNAELDFAGNNFTVEAWLKTSSAASQTIAQKRDANYGWKFWVPATSTSIALSLVEYDEDNLVYVLTTVAGNVPVTDNQWHHVVGVRSGGVITVYVDTRPVGSISLLNPATTATNTAALEIGRDLGPAEYFNGQIEELTLYKGRALSQSAINDHYEKSLGLRFQVRVSNDPAFGGIDFTGPTGVGDYYTSAALPTPSVSFSRTGQYLQYRPYFASSAAGLTPKLVSITAQGTTPFTDDTRDEFYQGTFSQTALNSDYIRLLTTYEPTAERTGNEPGLVALWHMNEGAGGTTADSALVDTYDDTGSLGGGVITNTPAWGVNTGTWKAPPTNALSFDGINDYVSVAHTSDQTLKYALTAEAWIRFGNNFPISYTTPAVVLEKPAAYRLRFNNKTSQLDFELYDNAAPAPGWAKDSGADSKVGTARLVHCMAEYKGKVYIGTGGDWTEGTAGTTADGRVYSWDGSAWTEEAGFTALTPLQENVWSMAVFKDKLYVGTGVPDGLLRQFDGTTWTQLWDTAQEGITALCAFQNAQGEDYLYIGQGTGNGDGDIYRWNGTLPFNAVDVVKVYDGTADVIHCFTTYQVGGKKFIVAGQGNDVTEAAVLASEQGASFSFWERWGNDLKPGAGNYESVFSLAVYNFDTPSDNENQPELIVGAGLSGGEADVFWYNDKTGQSGKWENPQGVAAYERVNSLAVYNNKLYAGMGQNAGDSDIFVYDGRAWDAGNPTAGWTKDTAFEGTTGASYEVVRMLQPSSDGYKLYAGMGRSTAGEADLYIYSVTPPVKISSQTITWTAGTWYHIAGGFDGATMFLAVNGVTEATLNKAFLVAPRTDPLYLGGNPNSREYFNGTIDEVALYKQNYLGFRTNGVFTGPTLTSSNGSLVTWEQLSWNEEDAYGDELIPATGLQALWHLNQDWLDGSGNSNTLAPLNGAGFNTAYYRYGGASGNFDGIDDYARALDNPPFNWSTAGLSIEAWIKTGATVPQTIVAKGTSPAYEFNLGINSLYYPAFWVSADGAVKSPIATGPATVVDNNWRHIAAVYNGSTVVVYVNGEAGEAKNFTGAVFNGAGQLWVGMDEEALWAFQGQIDEVAIYNRALSPDEVLSHYKHGALTLRFQVRAGNTNPPVGSFIGPDGTTASYYTIGLGETLTHPTIANYFVRPYIQYQADVATANNKYSPKLEGVKVRHSNWYSASAPWARVVSGQGYANPICTVSQQLTNNSWGAPSTGSVRYRFSPDNGTNWYYYNIGTTSWTSIAEAAAYSSDTTNALADLNKAIWNRFPNNIDPPTPLPGTFRWKAYLVSDGLQAVALDSVSFTDVYFEVKLPNGGENLSAGGSYDITWDYSGAAGSTVTLEYSIAGDSGPWYPVTTTSIAITPTLFTWNPVTNVNSTNCYIRATTNLGLQDKSNSNFNIVPGEISSIDSVTSPLANEIYKAGNTMPISWTKSGSFATVKIEYFDNGIIYTGAGAPPLSTANDGYYEWPIPSTITITNKGKVKVSLTDDSSSKFSDGNFIIKQRITVTGKFSGTGAGAPYAFVVDSTADNVTWTIDGVNPNGTPGAEVQIDYSRDDFNFDIKSVTSTVITGTNLYNWQIPSDVGPNYNVKVRVKAKWATYPFDAEDTSDAGFKIKGLISSVGKPGAGDILRVSDGDEFTTNDAETITWTRKGNISQYKIEISTNGLAGPYYEARPSTAGVDMGSYISTTFEVPITTSSQCVIRVSDMADSTEVSGTSSASFFTIRNRLILDKTFINDKIFTVGDAVNGIVPITWTNRGAIPAVEVHYSKLGTFADAALLATIDPNNAHNAQNGWAWTIENNRDTFPAKTGKIRIRQVTDNNVYDMNDLGFKIRGQINVITPTNGDVWVVGEDRYVTWTCQGNISQVEIRYTLDNGGDGYPVTQNIGAAPIASSNGTRWYGPWTVPNSIANQIKVKVFDYNDNPVEGISTGLFTIRGKLEITEPLSNTKWSVGGSGIINWNPTGSIGDIQVQYLQKDTDPAVDANWTVITTINAAIGGCTWNPVGDVITPSALIRLKPTISWRSNTPVSEPFTINSRIQVGKPVFGDPYFVYNAPTQVTEYPITWTYTGSVAQVQVQYKVGAGAWTPITTTSAGSFGVRNDFTFRVPDNISDSVFVRVLDADSGHPASDSPNSAQFAIKGYLKSGAPAAGALWTALEINKPITWSAVGTPSSGVFDNVKIEYTSNTTTPTWIPVIASTANISSTNNTYSWPTVADVSSDDCKIRISGIDALHSNVVAESGIFTIRGYVNVVSPVANASFTVAQTPVKIRWNKSLAVNKVALYYRTNGGSWNPIDANYSGGGG